MPVFRWGSTLEAFRDLEREMDRWVRSMDLAFEGLRLGRPFPSLNLFELEDEFLITAELPGCEASDLELNVANGVLTMCGNRPKTGDVPEERYRRSERPSGSWERTISLPDRVDEQQIRAELTHGLLRLHLPKLPATAPRQIQVIDGEEGT
jgi:HSP20 family protein